MTRTKTVSAKDQVQRILATLHQHSDIISMSLVGRITEVDAEESTKKGIAALTNGGALLPIGEGVFQLNPRIRRFLNERLSQFGAMQALTRITEQLQSGMAQWRALIEMRTTGDAADKAEMEEALGYTVSEIVYFLRQNMTLLNHQTASDFGNVETMRRKVRQNKFYAENVKILIRELDQLETFLGVVENDGIQFGLHEMRNMLVGQIKPQMSTWRHQLNEIQAQISKKLFVRRQIDADLRLLLDAALWMERNPTRNGVEVELGQSPSPVLLSPTPIKIRSHYDVSVTGVSQEKVLQSVAAKLQPPREKDAPKEARSAQVVVSTSAEFVEEDLAPEDALVQDLISALRSTNSKAFEILGWERERREAAGIGDEEWLFYASTQLEIAGVHTELQITHSAVDTANAVFDEVMVFPA